MADRIGQCGNLFFAEEAFRPNSAKRGTQHVISLDQQPIPSPIGQIGCEQPITAGRQARRYSINGTFLYPDLLLENDAVPFIRRILTERVADTGRQD